LSYSPIFADKNDFTRNRSIWQAKYAVKNGFSPSIDSIAGNRVSQRAGTEWFFAYFMV